jgi:hypothetical protein
MVRLTEDTSKYEFSGLYIVPRREVGLILFVKNHETRALYVFIAYKEKKITKT